MPDVPTTKILVIGSLTSKATPKELRATMSDEVRDTVRLYLDGRIEQWFARKDRPGVVFVLRTADIGEARTMLDALPLSKSGLLSFELIPLGPLAPLEVLLPPSPR